MQHPHDPTQLPKMPAALHTGSAPDWKGLTQGTALCMQLTVPLKCGSDCWSLALS